jgi:serine/threonine-protein kinase
VTVFDAGTEDGQPYLVMELLRGEDLGTRLRRLGRIPVAEALHVVAQVLRGLSHAHEARVVHRDLKPDNVFLLQRDGDPLFAKIVDFGISKIQRSCSGTTPLALTGKGTVLGTPLYMSPEQAQAAPDLDARADLYSVGAILFECLTGRPPHTGTTYEQVILSICMTDAPDLRTIVADVPKPVASFVAKALSRDRTKRFTSASQMLEALHEVAPAEKKRVPLEMAKTILSPSGEEELRAKSGGQAGPPTDVSWTAGSKPVRVEGAAARRSASSRAAVPLTALAATLAGVGMTAWIVSSMRQDAPKEAATASAITTASGASITTPIAITTTVATTTTNPGPNASTEPVVSPAVATVEPAPAVSAAVARAAAPSKAAVKGAAAQTPVSAPASATTPAPAKPKTTKSEDALDIQRDLP